MFQISKGVIDRYGSECVLYSVKYNQPQVLDLFIPSCRLGATGKDQPPLEIAIEEGYTDLTYKLLDNGCPIEIELGVNDYLPLVTACKKGEVELVKNLIKRGAGVDSEVLDRQGKDCHCFTALCAAAGSGNMEIVDILLKNKANVNYVPVNYKTAVYCACAAGHELVLKQLIKAGAELKAYGKENKFTSPLYAAVDGEHVDCVKILLQNGYRVTEIGTYITRPEKVMLPLGRAAEGNMVEIVKVLLKNGVDVNQTYSWYNFSCPSAIWFAAAGGCSEIVKILQRAGADLNVADKNAGRTPIMTCLRNINKTQPNGKHLLSNCEYEYFVQTLEILLNCGCDVNKKSRHKETTIMHAIDALPDADPLLKRIAHMDDINISLQRPIIREKISFGNRWGPNVQTPIQFAVNVTKIETAKLFMDMGVDIYEEEWWLNKEFTAYLQCNVEKQRELEKYAFECARKRKGGTNKGKRTTGKKTKASAEKGTVKKTVVKRKANEGSTKAAQAKKKRGVKK